MSTFVTRLMSISLLAVLAGCNNDAKTTTTPATAPAAIMAVDGKACVMPSGGKDVLRLTVPADAKFTAKEGMLDMKWHDSEVEVWLMPAAKSIDDAAAGVPEAIKSEFKNFKATSTKALTIAGAPASRMVGAGNEADDGDAGSADVILFKTGDMIFVACTHGEVLTPAAQQWMLTVIQTGQKP